MCCENGAFTSVNVPQVQSSPSSACQGPAIRAERYTRHIFFCLECLSLFPDIDIPELYHWCIVGQDCERPTIWTEDNPMDTLGMLSENRFKFSSSGIPQPNCIVPTPSCECFSIWTEGDCCNGARVSFERGFVFSGVDVPQPRRVIRARGCECFSIWTEGEALNISCVSFEGCYLLVIGAAP